MNARYEKGSLQIMGNTGDRIRRVRMAARLTQEQLARLVAQITGDTLTRGAVSNWEYGGGASRQNLVAIADLFDIDLNWLERGKGREPDLSQIKVKVVSQGISTGTNTEDAQLTRTNESLVHNARIAGPIIRTGQVPIKGRGMGGKHGALIFEEGEFFGETAAHPKVVSVPDAYAVYSIGDSMLERFKHGELVYVHPYAPYIAGDDVLIQVQAEDGDPIYGWIKRFISQDDKILKVEQLNPRKVLTFPIKTVRKIHKIVGSGAL